ncbi:MAG: hypothetical protein ISS15_05360 [Alphaproteobacteria bacterium]|nr:hypothetical protein [Alphaproteobacteria bacterium]MBL7097067.1 hypothetical protein [Alphaproteobacteria bacterium]
MSFGIRSIVSGSISAILKDKVAEDAKTVTQIVRRRTAGLKTAWRARVMGAGLSSRIGNAIRSQNYPASGSSLGAAGLVYAARGTPENLLGELEDGAIISSSKGFYLAIPTDNVPKGGRGKKLTPLTFEQTTGIKLQLARTKAGHPILVGAAVAARSRGVRPATARRLQQGRNAKTLVFFILVKQVTMKKRLDLNAESERAVDLMAAELAEELS